MILDTLDHASRYASMHEHFTEAFEAVRRIRQDAPAPGKYPIAGSSLFATVSTAEGKRSDQALLEAHRLYIDIHYVVDGHESIGWRPREECRSPQRAYSAEDDLEFFADVPALWIPVPAGSFALFFPTDAHAPLVSEGTVRKIVIKIRDHGTLDRS